jgi:hypothetical protein
VACADLAEQARARRNEPAADLAENAADNLTSWVGQLAGAPFTEHAFVATIPAERATWDAERTRMAGLEPGGEDLGRAGLSAPGRRQRSGPGFRCMSTQPLLPAHHRRSVPGI